MNIENTLTTATINNETVQAVDARSLYAALGVKKDFSDWVKQYTAKFIENQDYIIFPLKGENSKPGRPRIEYAFSLDMAKSIGLLEEVMN